MKKLIAVTGSFMFVCIIITSIVLPSLPKASADSPEENSVRHISADDISAESTDTESSQDEGYVLGEYNGFVAAYKVPGGEMIYSSKVSISNLPPQDRELLKNGIHVSSRKELKRLIEDYCS